MAVAHPLTSAARGGPALLDAYEIEEREKRAKEANWLLEPAAPRTSHIHIEISEEGQSPRNSATRLSSSRLISALSSSLRRVSRELQSVQGLRGDEILRMLCIRVLLDEETCDALRARRIGSVQVTIDGPPDVHDRMRPLANGAGSFWRIVENLNHAVDYFPVTIRVNVDARNISHVEELLVILARAGLAGRVGVYPGQIVGVNDGVPAPSASYRAPCRPTGSSPKPNWSSRRWPVGMGSPARRCRRLRERPAQLSGPTSWWSGVAVNSISAGTQWATSGRS